MLARKQIERTEFTGLSENICRLYESIRPEQQVEVLRLLITAEKDYDKFWEGLRRVLIFHKLVDETFTREIPWELLYGLQQVFGEAGHAILPGLNQRRAEDLFHPPKPVYESKGGLVSLFPRLSAGEKYDQLVELLGKIRHSGKVVFPKSFHPIYNVEISISENKGKYTIAFVQQGATGDQMVSFNSQCAHVMEISEGEIAELIEKDFEKTAVAERLMGSQEIVFEAIPAEGIEALLDRESYTDLQFLINAGGVRTELVRVLGVAFVAGLLPPGVAFAAGSEEPEAAVADDGSNPEKGLRFSPEFTNVTTAVAIAGMYVNAVRKGNFTPATAGQFIAAQAARLFLLRQEGNDKQVKRDMEILSSAALPIAITTIFADLFSESLIINQGELAKIIEARIEEIEGKKGDSGLSLDNIPSIDSQDKVQGYFEDVRKKASQEMALQAGYVLGISSGLGGMIMGVPTSQITNKLKVEVLKASTRKIFAEKVLSDPARYFGLSDGDKRKMYQEAMQMANTEFNGPFGFSMLAVVQGSWGMWGLHNSPSQWFMAKHPDHIAGQQARGFAATAMLDSACTLGWCAKMGFSKEESALVFKGAKDVLAKIGRDAAHIRVGGDIGKIADILSRRGSSAETLEQLKKLDPALFSLDIPGYCAKKSIALEQAIAKLGGGDMLADLSAKTSAFDFLMPASEAFLAGDYVRFRKIVEERLIPHLVAHTAEGDVYNIFQEILLGEGAEGAKVDFRVADGIGSVLDALDTLQVDSSGEDGQLLSNPDQLRRMEKASLLGLYSRLKIRILKAKDQHVLSPDAMGTAATISSQSLAVPSLVEVLEKLIINPLTKSLENGSHVSRETRFLIAKGLGDFFGGLQAGFADDQSGANMASAVATKFLKREFGEDVFEKRPNLLAKIDEIIALFMHVQGLLSRVGNPATMQQDRVEWTDAGEISARKLTGEELRPILPVNNGFAAVANGLAYTMMFASNRFLIESLEESSG